MAAWIFVFASEHRARRTFFDDAFIYLAVARNVVVTGKAQVFPIADNPGLVTSSPLRLATLVPATWLARLVCGEQPSRVSASLSLFLASLLTSALFLPFFRREGRLWGSLALLLAFLAATTNTVLQMEGTALYWCIASLVLVFTKGSRHRTLGFLLGLLFLARVEYGIAGLVACIGMQLGSGRMISSLTTWILAIATVGLVWCGLAALLGVWPIPTTFLTKTRTGDLRLFGPPFLSTLAETLSLYFPMPGGRVAQRVTVAIAGLTVLLVLSRYRPGRLILVLIFVVLALLQRAPGNFSWYHENLATVVLCALATLGLLRRRMEIRGRWNVPGTATLVLCALLAGRRLGRNDTLAWDLGTPGAYGNALLALANLHTGNGEYRIGDGVPGHAMTCYVATAEIGILSYFSGDRCWLFDTGGLAQAGTLEGAHESLLAVFYPSSVLPTCADELQRLRAATPFPMPLMQLRYDAEPGGDVAHVTGTRLALLPRKP